MSKIFQKISWLALTAIATASILISWPVTAAAQQPAGIQSLLQNYADQMHTAGTTGVLLEARYGNDAVWARAGVAKLGSNTPVPFGAHFKTGSTTKTFVSTVVLQLVGEGRLSLDDTVEHWLPGLIHGNGNDGSQITVRQLLNHTSGIFDYTTDDAFFATLSTPESFAANRFHTYTPQDLVNIALSHPPEFAPGASWSYSSTNYVIAGMLIKAATGKDWSTEVRNRILLPLGLTETSSAGTRAGLPLPFAEGYHIFTTDPQNRQYTNTTLHNMSWASSAGDIITTTNDENRFFQALMRGKLLKPAQLAEMKTIIPLGDGVGYGLGIIWTSLPCDSRGAWSHDGGVVGYATSNGTTDDGQRSVVVSLDTTTFTDLDYAEAVGQLRIDAVNDALCAGQPTVTSPQSLLTHPLPVQPGAVERLRTML